MRRVESIQALGPLQEGMLYHAASGGEPGEHLVQFVLILDDLDAAAFHAAWQALVEAHAVLRTGFSWDIAARSAPVGVLMSGVCLPWREEDWRDVSAGSFDARLQTFLASDRRLGFDLTRPPLMRASLIRETETRCRFVLSYHHLLMDGWSVSLLSDELAERYRALLAGTPPVLPTRRPYGDFLAWQSARDQAVDEAYWRRYLADAPATGVPLGSGTNARRMVETRTVLEPAVWERLRGQAGTLGVTLAVLTAGAWSLLLGRTHGETDVLFGATVSGRPETLTGSDAMIGLFINTVPVRACVSASTPLNEFLRRLQSDMAEARTHGHAPLSRIQSWAGQGRAGFETLFVYENYPVSEAATGSALGIMAAASHEETSYPCTLVLEPGPDWLRILLSHDSGRLSEDDARLLADRYRCLLASMADAEPTIKLAALEHLTLRDRQAVKALRAEQDALQVEPPLVSSLFRAAAKAHPEASALIGCDETITYQALYDRALAIALGLVEHGVGPGDIVGIAMPVGIARYVALMGILLSGAALFIIDTDQSASRIRRAVEAVRPKRIVTKGDSSGIEAVCLPFVDLLLQPMGIYFRRSSEKMLPVPALQDLAYVVLTSGSTGEPKPVGVSYRAIGCFALRHQGDDAPSRVLVHTMKLHFDASFVELALTLFSGGALVVPHADEGVQQAMERYGATHAALTPGTQALLTPERLPTLRQVIVGGESLPSGLADRWSERCVLLNCYGPTEATVYATSERMHPGKPVRIGKPLPYVSAYVLRPDLQAVGPGELGELYLAGPGLAGGYLSLPGATARSFVPDPFGPPGTRMYRTGDLVRIVEDNALAFVRRRDSQIKLRGLRVELGEIETAIFAVTGLGPHEIAVVLTSSQASSGERSRLVACTTSDLDIGKLGDLLSPVLPVPLQPQAVLRVPALPLTRTGKLDRQRLAQEAGAATLFSEAGSAKHETVLQERIGAALASALGLDHVSPDDDFFALGGDSLISLHAVSAARVLGLTLTPTMILRARTPRAMAAAIDRGPAANAYTPLLQVATGDGPAAILVGGAGAGPEAMIPIARGLAGKRVYVFVAPEGETTISRLAGLIVEAVQTIENGRSVMLIGHSFGAYIALETVRLLRSRACDASLVVLDATAPLRDRERPALANEAMLDQTFIAIMSEITGRPFSQSLKRQDVQSLLVEAGLAATLNDSERLMCAARGYWAENAAYVADPLWLPSILFVRAAERAAERQLFEPPPGPEPDWGWSTLTGGRVTCLTVGGNHISMLRGDAGEALGAQIGAYCLFHAQDDETKIGRLVHAE